MRSRFNNSVTEGMIAEVGNLTIWICRESVSTEAHKYIITIQENGISEGVEIGEVERIEDAYQLIDAIEKIQKA